MLTRALAGGGEDWVLRETVCVKCNHLFSRYERAWTSEPGVAMARCADGPVGRSRKGQAYQCHPSEQMFLYVDGDPIAYEVDVLPGIEPRFRYQIIDTDSGLRLVVSKQEDAERFEGAWAQFFARPEITIQKRRTAEGPSYRVALFDLSPVVRISKIETRSKPADGWWDDFQAPDGTKNHARLSLDPMGRLRFRTEKLTDVVQLLSVMLAKGTISSTPGVHKPGTYQVRTTSTYEVEKVHRAVAKTLANYAVDQFGVEYVRQAEFKKIIEYCIGGQDQQANGPFVGIVAKRIGHSFIDDTQNDRHALVLSSNGTWVVGIIKLYGSFQYRVHLGAAPRGTRAFTRGVRIDYNGRGRTDAISY
ncbi:MAG TPA: hypothetical protein VF680_08030 [Allosphingosinicella sp.]